MPLKWWNVQLYKWTVNKNAFLVSGLVLKNSWVQSKLTCTMSLLHLHPIYLCCGSSNFAFQTSGCLLRHSKDESTVKIKVEAQWDGDLYLDSNNRLHVVHLNVILKMTMQLCMVQNNYKAPNLICILLYLMNIKHLHLSVFYLLWKVA